MERREKRRSEKGVRECARGGVVNVVNLHFNESRTIPTWSAKQKCTGIMKLPNKMSTVFGCSANICTTSSTW